MPISKRILVTGSAGRIGRAVVKELKARGHSVRGLDLRPNPAAAENVVGSITDEALFRRAAQGIDTMIHLAATPDDDDFLTKLLPNNLVGTYNALEAAKAGGVKRVILASSGQVVWWQRFTGPLPIGVDVQPTPRGWYAATKMFAEAAGRAFAEAHGLSVMAVRLGWCPRDLAHAEELAGTDWGPDVYLSPGDAGRFFACAAEGTKGFKFAVVYACSKPPGAPTYDFAPTIDLTGFQPRDVWPEGSTDDLA
jgi:uronate dehydrogenase